MDNVTVARASALAGHYNVGLHGAPEGGVVIREITDLTLWQLAAWPETLIGAADQLAIASGVGSVPGFACATGSETLALLRIEPLKFWVYGASASSAGADESVVLDLSHSRTQLRISGEYATTLLNGYLPIDLRDNAFPVNSVASTAFHHVGVTLWRSPAGYELFMPRGFALSLWELLQESALQYGLVIE